MNQLGLPCDETPQEVAREKEQDSDADRRMLAACVRPLQDEPHWGEGMASIIRRLQ